METLNKKVNSLKAWEVYIEDSIIKDRHWKGIDKISIHREDKSMVHSTINGQGVISRLLHKRKKK